jgi:hypothetical protein
MIYSARKKQTSRSTVPMPLLWHWENNTSGADMSIELDLEEVKELSGLVFRFALIIIIFYLH